MPVSLVVAPIYPKEILIVPSVQYPVSGTGSAWSFTTAASTLSGGYLQTDDGTNANSVTWNVLLAAGTWKMRVTFVKGASFGQCSPTIDGASLTSLGGAADSFDCYAAVASQNNAFTSSGLVIAASGVKAAKFDMNIIGTGGFYRGGLQSIQFQRTA